GAFNASNGRKAIDKTAPDLLYLGVTPMSHVLLIEDDKLLGEGLRQFLETQGFNCTWLMESAKVEKHWYHADLVILDRQLAD
ncbi:hypothetical protein ACXWP9_09570, partial [Streptococcus pyogenes]